MRILNEQEKRDLLQQILMDLSNSQNALKDAKDRVDYYLRLETIYWNTDRDNFRHYYSDIFAWLTFIDSNPSIGNLDILAQNIQIIKDGYVSKNKDNYDKPIDISKEIIKLYDHVNLEIGRINYTKRMTGRTLSELARTKLAVEDVDQKIKDSEIIREKAIEDLNSESVKLKEEIRDSQKKMQSEYITILGIFAAIVLAFTGGMTFSGSVLENIDKASVYRILAIVLILGFIMFNLIWLLLDFLREINGKDDRKWWIILLVNGLFIGGLIFTFTLYRGHWLSVDKVSETFQMSKEVSDFSEINNTSDMESVTMEYLE